jgi:hypothetical protein
LVSDALLAVGIGVVSRFVGRFLEIWTRILGMALSPGFRIFSSGSLILHRRAYVIGMILSRKIAEGVSCCTSEVLVGESC